MASPAGKAPGRAVVVSPGRRLRVARDTRTSAKGPVSRILSCAVIPLGAASPRTLISDLPGGFGHCMEQPEQAPCRATRAALSHRADAQRQPCSRPGASLPIWSCSVWGLPCPGCYQPSGALLPHLFTLTPAWAALRTNPQAIPGRPPEGGLAEAVSFLWHWPSARLEARIPDVIRHTALRSSDFPPPANLVFASPPAATARSSCPC